MKLIDQLKTFMDMRSNGQFSDLKGIGDLAQNMVKTKKTHYVSTSLFSCSIGLDPTCCNCDRGKNIFYYEYCEKLAMKPNGRSMDE